MASRFGGLLNRAFITLLAALAVIGVALFVVFDFLSSSKLSEPIGLTVFIMVTGLLMGGYMLAFAALAFVGILALTRFWQASKKSPT